MYSIKYVNGNMQNPLMDARDETLAVTKAVLQEDMNKVPVLSIEIPVTNPEYSFVRKLQSEIVVTDVDSDNEIFRGRYLEDENDYYNTKSMECEGVMAYLLDVQYPPYSHSGNIEEFLKMLLDYYNNHVTEKQKIYIGNVGTADKNVHTVRAGDDYDSIYNIIQEKLVKELGGWIRLRRTGGRHYLDYLSEYVQSDQIVRFEENLLDFTQCMKADTIKTVIIPFGAEDEKTKKKLDITSVNNGLNYIKDDAMIEKYGWIEAVAEWEDVADAAELMSKANAYLQECLSMEITIELTAFDARLLGADVSRIYPGSIVRVISEPHHIDDVFLCSSKTTDILNPINDKITLGNKFNSISETLNREKNETNGKIVKLDKTLTREIEQSKKEFKDGIEQSKREFKEVLEQSKKEFKDELKQVEQDFKEELEQASGLFKTKVKQTDGSYVTYYHDKRKLETSQIRIVFNTDGFAVTSDGGQNWHNMKVDGQFVADILKETGIMAEWIIAGILKSADYKDEESGLAFDLDTSKIRAYGVHELEDGTKRKTALEVSGTMISCRDKRMDGSEKEWGRTTQIRPSVMSIESKKGKVVLGNLVDSPGNIQLHNKENNKWIQIGVEDISFHESSGRHAVSKTGRAEFSDGSYLDFQNGILVGGKTASGKEI